MFARVQFRELRFKGGAETHLRDGIHDPHQITLDLRPDADLTMQMEPPGLLLHHWVDGQGLVSHQLPIGDFEGPLSFSGTEPPLA